MPSSDPVRQANWSKWRNVPYVKHWEAVALSLGIDPGKVRISDNSWMAETLIFNESPEFKDREEVTRRNLGITLKATFNGISIREFAAWSTSIGWEVPPEFAALATHVAKQPSVTPPLEGKARVTALKLILGMALGGYGYNPAASKSGTVKEICDDLQLHGITLTDDTVRQWLREAAAEVDWEKS